MAGIYIHIPFCKQKCHYCNFFSVASQKHREQFTDALLKEMESRKNYLDDEEIRSVYFGGGTPSMLESAEINRILESVRQLFRLDGDAEITLEANPDDLDTDKLKTLKNETPVNRLSMGVQSFFDDDLVYLNRVHSGKQARHSIEEALRQGFNRLTIDLIYGIPTLTEEKWTKNLDIFLGYELNHLSAYALTVENKTALSTLIKKQKMQDVDEQQTVKHFELLTDKMQSHGFIHYEISNFARPGHYSRHNSIYWLGGSYLGLGPSAHSFNGSSRQWNVSSVSRYVEAATVEKIVQEKEVLTLEQRYNEYVMTSLRTSWGCDTEHIKNAFGKSYSDFLEREIRPFVEDQKVEKQGSTYLLTSKGKLFADGIAAALFVL